jgi:hypothetical protein
MADFCRETDNYLKDCIVGVYKLAFVSSRCKKKISSGATTTEKRPDRFFPVRLLPFPATFPPGS